MQKITFTTSKGLIIAGLLDFSQGVGPFPLVICLHGFGRETTKEDSQKFTDMLNPLGIATLRIDFQGAGESGGTYEDRTLTGFLDDACAALEYGYALPNVRKDKIGVIGHSMGGATALLLASKDTRISTVVVTSPSVKAAQVIADLYDPRDVAQAKQRGYTELRKSGEKKRLNFAFFEDAERYDITKEALNIPYPFLVIGAEKDTVVPFTQINEFCKRVRNARLITLPNSDHNLEKDWSIAAQEISNWFEEWAK